MPTAPLVGYSTTAAISELGRGPTTSRGLSFRAFGTAVASNTLDMRLKKGLIALALLCAIGVARHRRGEVEGSRATHMSMAPDLGLHLRSIMC